ncbi:ABC transporter ATP-binding protein [Pelagibacterium flavum]|uniref:ABC transporter ATP-binding protein n=1 Tax=Pelagibacterium flavum TaxID=2984530 RepID=A0ABY6IMR9_9HYPH|nr:ABC transporter ATP-binding protein [Pelagibacterium sp. YIM 151497]MAN75601.1 ABC transporter ATP-binding protein [Hyphomicrobiales bacterium]UYQ71896.1 ABC transporter ATP-binding protein [Pelagibacterium sp. YIM 151497]
MSQPVLSVKDLSVVFHLRRGDFTAVKSISFDIMPGEVLGVVGESGAGKSMTGTAIMGLVDWPGEISSTSITLSGDRIDGLDEESLRKIRGRRIGMVMQDPLTSLNPLFTVGEQLIETIRRHLPLSQDEARTRAIALLADAGIPDPESRIDSYPHQFSGGMRQRVVISLALAAEPELVIADEPTSALDVSVQAQIIKVLKRLCAERGVAVMLITHDMGVIAEAADRMIVMNKGEIVETGSVGDIINRPKMDYTIKLIEAIPSITAQNPRYAAAVAKGHSFASEKTDEPLVVVENLSKQFDISGSFLARITGRNRNIVNAVNGVSFTIQRGQTYGLVGESGSGKSTCARMMVGLLPPSGGSVRLEDTDIWSKGAEKKRRSKIQMIFQDPYASLNPRWRVGEIIAEPMRALGIARKPGEIADRVADLLERVRLDPVSMRKYPHEFSGGQRQRIAIARALSSQPEFIICDEPTSALDVSVQAQVLELMSRLQEEFGLTYLLISHNLAVVRQMADAVGVLHHGNLVESGPVEQIFSAPRADYTRMLLDAVPDISKVA